MSLVALFCLSAGLAGGALVVLDLVSESEEPYEAISTREVILLYLVNIAIASLIAYGLYLTGRIRLDFLAWIAVVLGYPLLLHTKIFTIRGASPDQDISVGFELVYQRVSKLLIPGIEQSIEVRGSQLVAKLRAMPMDNIVDKAKDYITAKGLPPSVNRSDLLRWLEDMKNDTSQHPENADDNKRAIFVKIREIGGYRGIRFIMRG